MNDKYRALEEAMKETDKAMTEEQKERRQDLDKAYKDYCREESKDHFSELRFAFIMAAKTRSSSIVCRKRRFLQKPARSNGRAM